MSKPKSKTLQKPYQPTPEERKAVEAMFARRREKPPVVRMKAAGTKATQVFIEADHEDSSLGSALLMASLGVSDPSLYRGLIDQLARLGAFKGEQIDADALNHALALVRAVEPRDELEAILATQMAAVHLNTMRMGNALYCAKTLQQSDSAERAFNKLTRTFAAQMEALRKHRNGGEQKVTVEHVTVNEGGQAIVGNLQGRRQSGGGGEKNGG